MSSSGNKGVDRFIKSLRQSGISAADQEPTNQQLKSRIGVLEVQARSLQTQLQVFLEFHVEFRQINDRILRDLQSQIDKLGGVK